MHRFVRFARALTALCILATWPAWGAPQIVVPQLQIGTSPGTAAAGNDPRLNLPILNACAFPADFTAGGMIAAAIKALPAAGGIVDARCLTGAQVITTALNVPAHSTLLLGSATFSASAPITGAISASIIGQPTGIGIGNPDGVTTIVQAHGANMQADLVTLGAVGRLQDVIVDGDRADNPSGKGSNVTLPNSHAIVDGVTSQNSTNHGIKLVSTGVQDQACCSTISKSMSINNAGDGLYCFGSADVMYFGDSFENNAGPAGVELNDCPTNRFAQYDIGGNQIGLWAHGAAYDGSANLGAGGQIVGTGQFGNNAQQDILLDGTNGGSNNNSVVGAYLLGSANRANGTVPLIEERNSQGNLYSAIQLGSNAGHAATTALKVTTPTAPSVVSGVQSFGPFTVQPFTLDPATKVSGACDQTTAACANQGGTYTNLLAQGNGTGYAATARTGGASAGDQYAGIDLNPSGAAYATVTRDFAVGNPATVLTRLFAQLSNGGPGATFHLQTANSSGSLADAIAVDVGRRVSFPAGILSPLHIGTGTGYAETDQTAGTSAADQYAGIDYNPSTAAFATVTRDAAIGTPAVVIARAFAQLSNGGPGSTLYQQTQGADGALHTAYTIGPDQRTSYKAPMALAAYTVSTLPACTASLQGSMAHVTDQSGTPTYGGALTGGGSTDWPAYCNGSAWTAH